MSTPTPITPADLARWQAVCEHAAPEPWDAEVHYDYWDGPTEAHAKGPQHPATHSGSPFADPCKPANADANFIAAARSAFPRLLAVAEAALAWSAAARKFDRIEFEQLSTPAWESNRARLEAAYVALRALLAPDTTHEGHEKHTELPRETRTDAHMGNYTTGETAALRIDSAASPEDTP